MIETLWLTAVIGMHQDAEKQQADKEHDKKQQVEESVPDVAREILLAADEATRAVNRVKYDCVVEGTGCQAPRVNTVKAHVTIVNSEADLSVAIAGMAFQVDGEEAHIIETKGALSADGAQRIDYDNRVMMTGPANLAFLAPLNSAFFVELAYPTPFSDEINARAATAEGRTFIGDVLCEIVWIDYGDPNNTHARWYFGVEDHLPRRVERLRPRNGLAGAFVQTIYNLEVDVKIDESMFRLETPEGYTVQQIDWNPFGGG